MFSMGNLGETFGKPSFSVLEIISSTPPPCFPCWKRDRSRSSGSTWASKQMDGQVAHRSSQFMSQAGSHSLHKLTLAGAKESWCRDGASTILGQLPLMPKLSSSLKPVCPRQHGSS